MAFTVQNKLKDGISNHEKSGVISLRSGVLEPTNTRNNPIFGQESNRKKKPYRARGCRGGASRKGRKKASPNGFSKSDSKEAKENNVDSANNGSIFHPQYDQDAGGKILTFRAAQKGDLEIRTSQPFQAPGVGPLLPVRRNMRYDSSEKYLDKKNSTRKGHPLQTSANEDHHTSKHSSELFSSSALTIKHDHEGRELALRSATQDSTLLKNPLSGTISTMKGIETGQGFDNYNKEPQTDILSKSSSGKRDLKRILPPDICNEIVESSAHSSCAITSTVKGDHDQQDYISSRCHGEGFSFFSVSPRSYLSGQRKTKAQRLF
ncbi:hypothetical protein ACHAXS_002816 [Conticribra weissflogii]